MPKSDLEKIQATFDAWEVGIANIKDNARSGEIGFRMIKLLNQASQVTATFQIALQLAKLNENIEELNRDISVSNTLRAGGGYP